MNIRLAVATDLLAICAIDYEAFSPYGTAEAPEIFAKRLAVHPEGFLIAEVDGEIIAYACTERWAADREPALDQDPTFTHHPSGRICCITGMAVRTAWRDQGIGTALLDRVIALASEWGCEKIVLETTHAVGFYQRRGFVLVHHRLQAGALLAVMAKGLTIDKEDDPQ
ncbi:MAG: GNAT family N-acetyltransferase [Caldilineaceae bacterium]|nr:GNAT family N-acetyltransferase [Caldilineaceae bacterium]